MAMITVQQRTHEERVRFVIAVNHGISRISPG